MSIKENLTGEQFVLGNLKEALQIYKIYYYPPEQNYPTDKIWLYFNRKEKEKYFGIKSLCFKNTENYKKFIFNNIYSYIYWLEKKGIEYKPKEMNISTFRMALLNDLLVKIRNEIPKRWKESLKIRVRIR